LRDSTSFISCTRPGHVEDVLQHLAHRLEDDREAAVLRGDRQQLGGPLALLPQRRAAGRVAAGEQQRAGGALAEAAGEQGEPPTSACTAGSTSSGRRPATEPFGASSVSGSRSTMPSSECIDCTSTP
jgi:hypothetical protein